MVQPASKRLVTEAALGVSVNAAAYTNFTTKADGAAPSALDSGQAVDFTFNSTGRAPKITSGRLVADTTTATSGSFADYYQVALAGNATRLGCEWTQPAGSDDGNGAVCLAAWGAVYEGTAPQAVVPQARCHLTVKPGTGTNGFWEYAVFRGDGSPYVAVKNGYFVNPPADGATRWTLDVVFDAEAAIAYVFLPDGTMATVSDAEVSAAFTVMSQTPIALMSLAANVAVLEHYASTSGNTAKYAGFTAAWAETARIEESRKGVTPRRLGRTVSAIQTPPTTYARVAPTTQGTHTATTSTTNPDGTNIKVTGSFGPLGKCLIELDCYYEFTGTDTVFGRFAGATPGSALEGIAVGTSGSKAHVHHTFEVTGGTPGQSKTWTYQHSSITGGLATLKWGGSGTSLVPLVFIKATPL